MCVSCTILVEGFPQSMEIHFAEFIQQRKPVKRIQVSLSSNNFSGVRMSWLRVLNPSCLNSMHAVSGLEPLGGFLLYSLSIMSFFNDELFEEPIFLLNTTQWPCWGMCKEKSPRPHTDTQIKNSICSFLTLHILQKEKSCSGVCAIMHDHGITAYF